jgi:hypothetical protein
MATKKKTTKTALKKSLKSAGLRLPHGYSIVRRAKKKKAAKKKK